MAGRYRFSASTHHLERSVIVQALRETGWVPTDGEDWDLHWSHVRTSDDRYRRSRPDQMINHVRGIGALTRKDRLAATVGAAEARLGHGLGIVPETHALPDGHAALMASTWPGPWIVKPQGGARGEGIWLAASAADVPLQDGVVVQRYLSDPHLIDGFKYTLRWYVAVTSVDPLVVHVFDDGFTKLTSRPYRVDPASLSDRFVHLTNPDVQATNPEVATSARNLTRPAYRDRLAAAGHDPEAVLDAARRAVIGCVVAAREQLVRDRLGAARTFELLGFDVLIDADLHAWVIEANLSPSVTVEAADDSRAAREESALKERMALDLLELIGASRPWDGPPLRDVGGWRLAWPAPTDDDLWHQLSLPRPADALAAGRPTPDVEVDPGTRWWDLGDGLAVLSAGAAEPIALNLAAAVAHLGVAEGLGVEEIATELRSAGVPVDEAGTWDVLADLVDRAALRRSDVPAPAPLPLVRSASPRSPQWNDELHCTWGGATVVVHPPGPAVAAALRQSLRRWTADADDVAGVVEVHPSASGWAVGGRRVSSMLELGPAVRAAVVDAAVFGGAGFVLRGTVVRDGGRTVLLLGRPAWRAARAKAADAVLGDDHLMPTSGGRLDARPIGLEAPVPRSDWTKPLGREVELSLGGELVDCRVVAEAPTSPLLVDHLEVEGRSVEAAGPTDLLLLLLAHGIGRTDGEAVESLVDLARRLG